MKGARRTAGLAALLLALLGLEGMGWLAGEAHHGGFWNSIPLWDLGFGFAGAAALWLITKRVMGPLLSRPESWYRRRRRENS